MKQLLLLIGIFTCLAVQAQVVVNLEKTQMDNELQVNVQVENFNNVAGFQFPLYWDKNALKLKSVKNLNEQLKGFDMSGFALPPQNSQPGSMKLLWVDPATKGISLQDGDVLFTINYEVLRPQEQSRIYATTDKGFQIEFVSGDVSLMNYTFTEGEVAVSDADELTATQNQGTPQTGISLFPNPATDELIVQVEEEFHSQAPQYIVYNASGAKVLSGRLTKNLIEVSGLEGGIYLLYVKGVDREYSTKFVKR